MHSNKVIKLLAISFLVALFCAVFSENANASSAIVDKALAEGLYQCYKNGEVKKEITANKITDLKELFTNTEDGAVKLPTDLTDIKDDDLRCYEVLKGYDGSGGKIPARTTLPSSEEKADFFKSLGYTAKEKTYSGGKCLALYYADKTKLDTYGIFYNNSSELEGNGVSTHWLCIEDVEGDTVKNATLSIDDSEGSTDAIQWELNKRKEDESKVQLDCLTGNFLSKGKCEEHTIKKGESWSAFVEEIVTDAAEHASTITKTYATGAINTALTYTYTFGKDQKWVKEINKKELEAVFEIKNATTAGKTAVKTVFGLDGYSKYALTKQEKFVLYQKYLTDFYKADIICDPTGEGANLTAQTAGREKTRLYIDGKFNDNCYARATQNNNKKVNGVKSNLHFSKEVDFAEVAKDLAALTDVTELPDDLQTELTTSTTDPDSQNDEQDPTCYDAGGSLGWILCPILEFTTDTVNTLYDSVIEPYLAMDVALVDKNQSGDSTFKAWQSFQGIANVCFVVLFLIVIFSQITGFGIDNYGIKKIMPKLITAALLINLSYIICTIAIDLSNIVGSGMKSLFDSLIQDVQLSKITVENGTEASFGATAVTSGVALLAIIVGAVALYTNGAAVLIPLFIAAISVLVSIFSLFVLLSLRKAAVIILVVVSPVALGCYMLPNTKKIFDRWFKALQGMLLLYPIAGTLVGAGNYVSKLLLSTGSGTTDFFFALSAMIIGIVPIFFIPGLLKTSFAAIGGIGAKLSSMSRGVSGKFGGMARRGLEHSALTQRRDYNRMSREQARQARTGEYNYRKAQKTLNKLGETDVAKMNPAQRAKYRTALNMVDAENRNMQDMYAKSFDSLEVKDINKQVDSMLDSGKFDVNMATAAINAIGGQDQGKMLETLDKMSSADGWKKMNKDDRSRIAKTLSAQGDNAVAQAYGKVLNKSGSNASLKEALTGVTDEKDKTKAYNISQQLREMDSGVLANQSKDTLEYISKTTYEGSDGKPKYLADAFTSEQIGHAISESDGQSKKSVQLQSVLAQRSDLSDDIYHMTDAQMAKAKSSTIEGAMTKRFGTGGRTSISDNQAIMKTTVKAKIDNVRADDNLKGNLDVGFNSGSFK